MDFASILTMTEAEYTAMKRETGRYDTMRARVKAFCDQLPDRRCYDTIAQYLRVKLRESEATKEELLWLAEQDKMQSTLEYVEHKINEADATTKPYDDRPLQKSSGNSNNSNPFKVPEQQTKTITLKRLLSTGSDKAPIVSTPNKKNKTTSSLLEGLDRFNDDYDDEWSIVETTTTALKTSTIVQRPVTATAATATATTAVVTSTSITTTIGVENNNNDVTIGAPSIVTATTPVMEKKTDDDRNDAPIVKSMDEQDATIEKTSIVAKASLYTKQSIIEKYLRVLSSIVTTLDDGKHTLRMYFTYVQINNKLDGDGKEKKSLFVVSSSLKPQFVAIVGHYRQGEKKGVCAYHHRNVVVFSQSGQDVNELRKQLRLLFKAGQEHRGDGSSVDSVKLPYFMVGHVHLLFNQKAIYQMLCGNGEDDEMDEQFCKSVNDVMKGLSFVY